jgi:nitrite reductase (NO-forming)
MKLPRLQNNTLRLFTLLGLAFFSFYLASCQKNGLPLVWGEEVAKLTDAPDVPPPIHRIHATKVIVTLEVIEQQMRLADGVEYVFWTFGGKVPGKFIRVREGDLVEFHLQNRADSKMPHNIDLHGVTGPGGGAASSFTAPGHASTFSFRAINPGLYIYHCATAPVGMHIANGMYGLILVEPKAGLPKVDREFYVVQGDFYTKGTYGQEGVQPFDMSKALEERATYVVFNGAVGSMAGKKALSAKVGEKVRIYFGNGGPNLVSSFHVIGTIFENVYGEGGTEINQHNVQSTLVPAGGSVMVDFKCEVPGNLILVDHSIFRAFNKGALGIIKVEGEATARTKEIYSGKIRDDVLLAEGGVAQDVPSANAKPLPPLSRAEKMAAGERLYAANCLACHQANAEGIAAVFPPLAGSDFLKKDRVTIAQVLLKGLEGPITVNGNKFVGVMPSIRLSDRDIASVLTYVGNSWNNNAGEFNPEEIAKIRETSGH